MRVAIIHDHFLYLGGAERVLISLLKIFPQAEVYTLFITKENRNKLQELTSGKIYDSPFNKIYILQKYPDLIKPLVYAYWQSLDLSKYDLILSSSHSFSSKAVVTNSKQRHISYVYTPPRYLYTEYNETQIIKHPTIKVIISPLMSFLRLQDFLAAQGPDVIIACSKAIQKRIRKYYRRDSTVIYPPMIAISDMRKVRSENGKSYFLVVSRLVKQKGIDLAIQACKQLNLPLVIVGEGKERKNLEKIAGPTITFKGFIPDAQMPQIYAKAKALIYCSKDEDFGMVPVEAMAHGVPIIAYNSGGASETVINNKTGLLFNNYDTDSLIDSIKKFDTIVFSQQTIKKQANKFSEQLFHKELLKFI